MLGTSIVLASCSPGAAQLFEISKPTFSYFVTQDKNYTPVGPANDGKISRATLSRGLLYFSFTIVGGQAAIDYLKDNRRLEAEVVIMGDRSERISGLGISQDKWSENKQAWLMQFDELGYFTFRTFMNTQKISQETMELQVRDAKSNIVRPIGYNLLTYRASVTIVP
jgi:hypothetical protein